MENYITLLEAAKNEEYQKKGFGHYAQRDELMV